MIRQLKLLPLKVVLAFALWTSFSPGLLGLGAPAGAIPIYP